MSTNRSFRDTGMSPWQMDKDIYSPSMLDLPKESLSISTSPQFVGSASRSQTGSWRRASQKSHSLFIWGWMMTTKVRIMHPSIYWWTFGWEPIVSKYHYSGIKQRGVHLFEWRFKQQPESRATARKTLRHSQWLKRFCPIRSEICWTSQIRILVFNVRRNKYLLLFNKYKIFLRLILQLIQIAV